MQNVTKKPGSYQSKRTVWHVSTHISCLPTARSLLEQDDVECVYMSDSDPLSEMNFCFVLRSVKGSYIIQLFVPSVTWRRSKSFLLHLPADFKRLVCVWQRICKTVGCSGWKRSSFMWEKHKGTDRNRASGQWESLFMWCLAQAGLC